MRAALHSRTKNGEHLGVLACERARSDRGRSAGPNGSDISAVHEALHLGTAQVEDSIHKHAASSQVRAGGRFIMRDRRVQCGEDRSGAQ